MALSKPSLSQSLTVEDLEAYGIDSQYVADVLQGRSSSVAALVRRKDSGVGSKRSRVDSDDDQSASGSGSGNAVYHFAFTWNLWDAAPGRPVPPTFTEFGELFVSLRTALVALGSKYVFQLEKGASGRLHYQGYVHITKGKKLRPATLAATLAPNFFGIHLSAASTAGKAALQTYCMKDETRVSGPWKDTDVKPISADEMKRLKVIDSKSLYPFQQQIEASLDQEPDDRTIHCVIDPQGARGKSSFAKLMGVKGKCLPLQYIDAKDCMHIVSSQGERKAYIFDLAKTKPALLSSHDTYTCMEQIKNGMILSGKYVPVLKYQPPAHVYVFTNRMPPMSALSKDRWRLHSIDSKNRLVPFDKKAYDDYLFTEEVQSGVAKERSSKRQKLIADAVKAQIELEDAPTQPLLDEVD